MFSNDCRIKTAPSRAGVTLVELLVVLSICAAVISVIASVFGAGIQVWATARTFNRERSEASICLERMERELKNSFNFHGLKFEGDAAGLRFAALVASETDGGGGRVRISRIEYRYSDIDNSLGRTVSMYPDPVGDSEKVISSISGTKFSYAMTDAETGITTANHACAR